MIASLYRPVLMSLVPLGLIACANSPPTLADREKQHDGFEKFL